MSDIAIALKNVSKCYNRYERPVDRLKEILLPNRSHAQQFWALRDINLTVYKGETLGIIGQNGSGKSTLLQIIAKTLTQTTGEVEVNGRVSALLELGSGFNPEFTGRQNVFFNGQLLGLTKREVEARFDEIASFADIGDFIDQPVKTYSSGMFVRLAFAVAINVDPEILIVDEALSVGDGVFVHRCMAKIKDFQDANGTILFVSHDIGSINRLCSRCIWINGGQVVEQGNPVEISKSYQAWMYEKINERIKKKVEDSNDLQTDSDSVDATTNLEPEQNHLNNSILNPFTAKNYLGFSNVKRFGTGRCEVISLETFDLQGKKKGFVMPGDNLILTAKIACYDRIDSPIFGIMMFDRLRVPIAGWNTTQYEHKLPPFHKNQIITVNFKIKWPHIKSDTYSLEPAIADGSQESHEMMDWVQAPLAIESGVTNLTFGFIRFTEVSISHKVDEFEELAIHQVLSDTLVK